MILPLSLLHDQFSIQDHRFWGFWFSSVHNVFFIFNGTSIFSYFCVFKAIYPYFAICILFSACTMSWKSGGLLTEKKNLSEIRQLWHKYFKYKKFYSTLNVTFAVPTYTMFTENMYVTHISIKSEFWNSFVACISLTKISAKK